MRLMLLILLLGMLVGCGSWQKPGMTVAQRDRDMAECKYEADSNTGLSSARGGIAQGVEEGTRMGNLMRQCMQLRGYALARD